MSISIALPEPAPTRAWERCAARLTIAAADLLLISTRRRLGLRHRLLRLLARTATRPASPADTARAHRAITAVSPRCASGHGCLPRSLAVVLWCRATGHHATWILGAATGPLAAHAWVEAAGQPVANPVNPHLLYTSTLTI
ncbi:lasso peptide biosynthesis B2 protein [Candidatus Protofrankia californiensis]|uniref:lasso peptide biosynthesis B2 protein n=1 Tax=Candidatus Protofrankia californiensis TaxID=1839754 RepID=UPI0010416044|nr:lasso peptide biosynthesis B2 protein [Candidatus Protofrankia californiensis]